MLLYLYYYFLYFSLNWPISSTQILLLKRGNSFISGSQTGIKSVGTTGHPVNMCVAWGRVWFTFSMSSQEHWWLTDFQKWKSLPEMEIHLVELEGSYKKQGQNHFELQGDSIACQSSESEVCPPLVLKGDIIKNGRGVKNVYKSIQLLFPPWYLQKNSSK